MDQHDTPIHDRDFYRGYLTMSKLGAGGKGQAAEGLLASLLGPQVRQHLGTMALGSGAGLGAGALASMGSSPSKQEISNEIRKAEKQEYEQLRDMLEKARQRREEDSIFPDEQKTLHI